MTEQTAQHVLLPSGRVWGSMGLSAFHVWVNAGRSPFWGDVEILSERVVGGGRYDVVVEGDGFELERMIRKHSDTFLMFERGDTVLSGNSVRVWLLKVRYSAPPGTDFGELIVQEQDRFE